ncbi:hypothetical protein D3C76_983500 [compost metagenome]
MAKTITAANEACNVKEKEIRLCPGVLKELGKFPEEVQISFLHNLDMVAHGLNPTLAIDHLSAVGAGVIELKINGSPAYRCVYYNKMPGVLWVVVAATKTSQGQDLTIIRKAKERIKTLKNTD